MKKIIYLILIMFAVSGCNDFLNKRDPTATSFVEFFNDEEDLRQGMRDGFNICKYSSPGCGEAAYAFIPGIDECEFTAPEQVRQHTKETGQDP